MKKYFFRIICFIIVLTLLISFVSCGNDSVETTQTTVQTTAQTSAQESTTTPLSSDSFCLDEDYTIVRNNFYSSSVGISESILYLRKALQYSCGVDSSLGLDTAPVTDDSYEIIIGDTQRAESKDTFDTFGINDYGYCVISEKKIVIRGGSSDATLKAVKKFCLDVLEYEEGSDIEAGDRIVKVGASYLYTEQYPYDSMSINGIDLQDFVIACRSGNEFSLAVGVSLELGKYTGYSTPVVRLSDLKGDERAVICINSLGRKKEDALNPQKFSGYRTELLSFGEEEFTCSILATSTENIELAVAKMIENAEVESEGRNITLKLSNEIFDEFKVNDVTPWTLKSKTSQSIADGVKYSELTYTGELGRPHKAFVLEIDPDRAYLYMGTGGDTYESVPSERQNVMGHMESAVANGVNIIAGVNGDYFNISGDYSPSGVAIKEGKMINTSPRPFCAFTYDGEFVIKESISNVATKDIRTAVGGSNVIVKNFMPYDMNMSQSHGYISHPRTLAGVKSDGTIILAVIDGRQPTHSNGASLAECAQFMLSMGVKDAINLDGGGSSTMITRVGDSYITRNRPSDGSLRRVYSSLLVVLK